MSTLFERATSFLNRVLPQAAGGRIIYSRGNSRTARWINATWGRTEYQSEVSGSMMIEHTDRDFIVATEDLILDGNLATPQRGDRIEIVSEEFTDGEIYEVFSPGGSPPFSLIPDGTRLRIHGKRVLR